MGRVKQHHSNHKSPSRFVTAVYSLYYYLVKYNASTWYVYTFFILVEFLQVTHRTLESMSTFYESIGKSPLRLAEALEYIEVYLSPVFMPAHH